MVTWQPGSKAATARLTAVMKISMVSPPAKPYPKDRQAYQQHAYAKSCSFLPAFSEVGLRSLGGGKVLGYLPNLGFHTGLQ